MRMQKPFALGARGDARASLDVEEQCDSLYGQSDDGESLIRQKPTWYRASILMYDCDR